MALSQRNEGVMAEQTGREMPGQAGRPRGMFDRLFRTRFDLEAITGSETAPTVVSQPDGTIASANDAYRRLAGADGVSPVDLLHRQGEVGRTLLAALAERRTCDETVNFPDADDLERMYRVRLRPLNDELVLWRFVDVTAEQRRQQDLEVAHTAVKSAQNRFALLFDSAPVAVVTLDDRGRLVSANEAFTQMLGLAAPAEGPLDTLAQEGDGETVRTWVGKALEDDAAAPPLEVALKAAGGQRQVVLYAGRMPAPDEDGARLVVHAIDTTDQRTLEMQFAQSQKMQAVGQLAGGVAHDFNNLLTAIIGHCDLLLLKVQAGNELFPDLMQVKQNANRAANLVRQLLAFSRQQTLRPKVLDLTDVLAELSHLLRRLIGENIDLDIRHSRDLWPVKVDQGQFEQVVINLAVNARDAMSGGGRLWIRTRNITAAETRHLGHELMPTGEYVEIEVGDTGKGIKQEDLGRIFEPFFTTKSPGSGAGSGTGLGLSTVFGIIKQTGGFIYPESEIGNGAVFRIYLPRHRELSRTGQVAASQQARAQDLTGKGTVLLVEDEDAVRQFATRALRNKGYTVLEAASGDLALELLDEHEGDVDLLITDVVMPQMDGPTLVNKIRERGMGLKVVFISGYAEDAFRRNLDRDRDFDLLPKPFSLKQLAEKVKDVMG